MKMINIAIIVGAGIGKRMENIDKSFLLLNGKPILVHSILPFEKSNLIDEIIIVVKKDKLNNAKKVVSEYKFKKVKKIISGGRTRQNSVFNGLCKIKNADIVLVHDMARPLIDEYIIKDCINNAKKFWAAIPAFPIKDTIKKGDKFVEKTIDRKNLNLAQTPQAFKYQILKKAYESAKESKFIGTDDASLVEKLGYKIKIIPGSSKNIKITIPEDMIIAENLLKEDQNKVEIKAYAKINLNFEILKKLPNGYHKIRSKFQAIDIYDTLMISKEKSGFKLTGSIICPTNLNLITKAKNILEDYVKKKLPCKIQLIKSIPISAGLGGGSSDAAATMIGLNKIYELSLSLEKLKKIALKVGSDVPFFISNFGTALVEGVGEKIKPLKVETSKIYVLVRPHKRISTAEMYKEYDKTKENFFEIAKRICPIIIEIYNHFSKKSNNCRMSGSGPTIFAEFSSYDEALKAIENFDIEKFEGDLFICRSIMKTYDIIKCQDKD